MHPISTHCDQIWCMQFALAAIATSDQLIPITDPSEPNNNHHRSVFRENIVCFSVVASAPEWVARAAGHELIVCTGNDSSRVDSSIQDFKLTDSLLQGFTNFQASRKV